MRRRLKAAHYKNLQRLALTALFTESLLRQKSKFVLRCFKLCCRFVWDKILQSSRDLNVLLLGTTCSISEMRQRRDQAWDSSAFSAFSSPWGGCIECHLNLIGSSWKYIILIFCHIAAVWHFAGSVTKLQTQTFPVVFIPLLLDRSFPVVVFLTRQTHTFAAKFVCPWHSYQWYIHVLFLFSLLLWHVWCSCQALVLTWLLLLYWLFFPTALPRPDSPQTYSPFSAYFSQDFWDYPGYIATSNYCLL